MLENQLAQTKTNEVALQAEDMRIKMQNFTQILNKEPMSGIDLTPDKKAKTINISHIEMTLDEMFFGAWSTENFKWTVIQNEVVGSLELVVMHPVTGMMIRRTGAASIIIQVDKVPDEIKNNSKARNIHALSPENKKPNALDMGFPKLKAECTKNAAQSLGKVFGRDLNRGEKADIFNPLLKKEALKEKNTITKPEMP
ncbi:MULTISPECIES: hypothetical protein [Elizabethkingia]|uniref:hypothetical protein n=1 Tax=Elizabethkingia TaxID=308865 RepID=UPI0021A920E9|nr:MULTISPECIES: hypothetical protein [Elizabethkingia]MCT3689533.1 hypothetical protein [Elizabethkingia anophelis]MCT3706378.1 hypothetical protein [Elizabethkingia anophelis]MCT3713397.1 hypothetical protein [Elizabethkingia anophelis]MCT3716815.1 hypothetical protein [Elizabethkingia anophelis]MCT3730426.1 hypothetical protein [Elizabethkingia anophelis]